jgi:hypothetical protein
MAKKSEKQYLVRDPEDADRIYTKEVHGFNFELKKGEVETVNEAEMKLLKAASPFLSFEEVTSATEATVFGEKLGGMRSRRRYRN